jgi:hypothetical protein
MRKLNDPGNIILDTIENSTPDREIFGNVEGFTATTFFSESRNIFVDKVMICSAWESIKSDPNQRYLRDNHNIEIPPVGYAKNAFLVENGDFLGIYAKVDILDRVVWKKFESGEYKGFSAAFGKKLTKQDEKADHNITIEVVVEKNSYNDTQINTIKSSFSPNTKVVVNEVMRFSEIPSQIININVFLNIQYLLQTIQNHPIESGAITVGGMILTSAIDAVVKDIYSFLKKGAKTLFEGKSKPKLVVKNTTLDKNILIKIEANTPDEMQNTVKLFSETYSQLIKDNKTNFKKAKRILFESIDGNWRIKLDL